MSEYNQHNRTYTQLVYELNISAKSMNILAVIARHRDKKEDLRIQRLMQKLDERAHRVAVLILSNDSPSKNDATNLLAALLREWGDAAATAKRRKNV